MKTCLFLDVLPHEQACNLQKSLQMGLGAGWTNLLLRVCEVLPDGDEMNTDRVT